MRPVETRLRLSGAETVIVAPQAPLRDGVRYRLTVRAGASGIRGAEGEQMAVDRVWGFDSGTSSNALEVYVGYLRRKLEADGEPRVLQTVRGVGYQLLEPS